MLYRENEDSYHFYKEYGTSLFTYHRILSKCRWISSRLFEISEHCSYLLLKSEQFNSEHFSKLYGCIEKLEEIYRELDYYACDIKPDICLHFHRNGESEFDSYEERFNPIV